MANIITIPSPVPLPIEASARRANEIERRLLERARTAGLIGLGVVDLERRRRECNVAIRDIKYLQRGHSKAHFFGVVHRLLYVEWVADRIDRCIARKGWQRFPERCEALMQWGSVLVHDESHSIANSRPPLLDDWIGDALAASLLIGRRASIESQSQPTHN